MKLDDDDILIRQWAKLIAESVDRSGSFEVKTIKDKDLLGEYIHDINDIIQKSYAFLGGFKGGTDAKHIQKNTDLAKLAFNKNNEIVAVSLYRDDLGGYKRFASGTNKKDPNYRDVAKAIIKTDIYPYDNWYWAEVSGPIENYFKKLNGNPIPNHLARIILNLDSNKEIRLEDDGVHYSREIGTDGDIITKMLFGFKSQEIYDRVMKEIENYPRFKINVNKHMESYFTESKTDENAAMYIIHNVYDFYFEWGFREMLPSWHEQLVWARKIIEDALQKDLDKDTRRTYEALLRRADTCFEEMPLLEGHQFRLEDANL